jgi:hypothetical protein
MPRREFKHPSQIESGLTAWGQELRSPGEMILIGSAFEKENGWHVNLMPPDVLSGFPSDWRERASIKSYGALRVIVPTPVDLLVPKLARGEPRDFAHADWSRRVGLC